MTDETYHPKAFCCHKCGWILGESYRESGSRVTQLRVYRAPRHPGEGLKERPLNESFVFAVLRMNDGALTCACGEVTTWYANQTAMDEMINKRRLREVEHGKPV